MGRALLGILVVGVGAVSVAAAQEPGGPACEGEPATIVGSPAAERLEGTAGRDVIVAGAGDDRIFAGPSRDIVCAALGNDTVLGGRGYDAIVGGQGGDTIAGGQGTDAIRGGPGNDRLSGALGSDRIDGGFGGDRISGGNGSDLMHGGPETDALRGGRGNDVANGGPGDADLALGDLGDDRVLGGTGIRDEAIGGLGIDHVNGGPGDFDFVDGGYGWDVIIGGGGSGDTASFAAATSAGDGVGVWASLRRGRARGDGRDALRLVENLEGSAFNDVLIGDDAENVLDGGPGDDDLRGGPGGDALSGDTGVDRCRAAASLVSCGGWRRPRAPAFVQADHSLAGGGGLAVLAGAAADRLTVAFDPLGGWFTLRAARPLAIGDGCVRVGNSLTDVACHVRAPVRHLVVDLGAGNDDLRVEGSLASLESVRFAAGPGDDRVGGGAGAELIEADGGADRLLGGGGSDGLIGGIPGPDALVGGPGSDLLAAGDACIGGVLRGGPGRDNASFAETPAHPGVLEASLAAGLAWNDAVAGCRPVRLARSNEDLEGSFDWDVLTGDGGSNNIFGQPGRDRFFGRAGSDVIDARDGESDFAIDCGGDSDTVFRDPSDPPGSGCREVEP